MPFIGKPPAVGAYSVLDALTASATANYSLQLNGAAFVPNSVNQLLVSLNGVIQKPGSSFVVSGSTLTFKNGGSDQALTSSDSIDFIISMGGDPLNVGIVSDGTISNSKITGMAASKLSGALPAISGASLTGISAGITNAQTWRITSNASLSGGGGNIITSNWEEADTYGYTRIGSVATAPSGGNNYFSFGATGIYLMKFFATGSIGASTNVAVVQLEPTFAEDGSTFNYPVVAATSVAGVNTNRFCVYTDVIFDVTNVSTHRFRYRIYPSEANVTLFGSTNANYSGVTFIRLGDT